MKVNEIFMDSYIFTVLLSNVYVLVNVNHVDTKSTQINIEE